MPGPPPKPDDQRRRRNAPMANTRKLARSGRTDERGKPRPAPKWPLPKPRSTSAELEKLEATIWAELWRMPQALEWERQGADREVAQYVRWKARAELGELDASREARMLADRLGLTPMSMLRLRWEVVDDELAQRRETSSSSGPSPAPRPRSVRAVDVVAG